MSDKVQFQTNVPVDVALKYNDGKEVTGQYGDQVLYALTDGRVMYVPPIVKKKIDELGIGRGELFTITKRRRRTERGAPSSGWLRQTDAEIENLKGASSSRTAQRRLSAAADPDRRRQTEMVTGRVHSAMPKAFW
jgi:hypothetical protein